MRQTVQQAGRPSLWSQRLFVVVLGINVILISVGAFIVPSTFASGGVVPLLGAICMQVGLGALAFVGSWSFRRCRSGVWISFALGGIFALLYLSDIVVDFNGGSDPINIYGIFVAVALVAGFAVGYRTRQWSQGLFAAIWALVIGTAIWSAGMMIINYATWGSHLNYLFWLGDGAIGDFQRSGGHDLYAFLLQDLQGALFFHPILSAVMGVVVGGGASAAAQCILWAQRALKRAPAHG